MAFLFASFIFWSATACRRFVYGVRVMGMTKGCVVGNSSPVTKRRQAVGLQNYSHRRASMGLRRAAFHAGHNPNTIPTAAEIPTPTAIAHNGTYAGRGEYLFINKLATSPTANPAKPPIAVSTTASIRN